MTEDKTPLQLLMDKHTKANSAWFKIKKELKNVVVVDDKEWDDETKYRLFIDVYNNEMNTISKFLSDYYDSIMKSNKNKKITSFRPIKTKHLTKEDNMAAKKAVKKPVAKKPMKKTTKKTK